MKFKISGRTIQQHNAFIGVQDDNGVEIIDFELPRIYGETDLYTDGIVYIACINSAKESIVVTPEKFKNEDDTFTIRWIVGSEVTAKKGTMHALIRIESLMGLIWQSFPTTFQIMNNLPFTSPQPVFYSRMNSKAAIPIEADSMGMAALYSVEVQADVADTIPEPFISISNRKINIPSSLMNIATQNDSGTKLVYIEAPRYYDGHDLGDYVAVLKCVSSGGKSEIMFTESSTKFTKIVFEDKVRCKWTLLPPQTSYAGSLKLQFYLAKKLGDESYKWETDGSSSVNIYTSIDAQPVIPTTPGYLEEFLTTISNLAEETAANASTARDKATEASTSATEAKNSETLAMMYAVGQNPDGTNNSEPIPKSAKKYASEAGLYSQQAAADAETAVEASNVAISQADRAKDEADRAAAAVGIEFASEEEARKGKSTIKYMNPAQTFNAIDQWTKDNSNIYKIFVILEDTVTKVKLSVRVENGSITITETPMSNPVIRELIFKDRNDSAVNVAVRVENGVVSLVETEQEGVLYETFLDVQKGIVTEVYVENRQLCIMEVA